MATNTENVSDTIRTVVRATLLRIIQTASVYLTPETMIDLIQEELNNLAQKRKEDLQRGHS